MHVRPFPEKPFISVVVPLFNEERRLPELARALKDQTYDNYEIILVDNNSRDGTERFARELFGSRARILSESKVQNADAARNTGIAAATGEILAFTDGDCTPTREWLAAAGAAFGAGGIGLVAGRIEFTFDCGRGGAPGAGELYDSISFLQHSASVTERGVAFTANLFVARHVIDIIGAFDLGSEWNGDFLLTRRAVDAGFRLVYCDGAVVRHPARGFADVIGKSRRIAWGKGLHRSTGRESPGQRRPDDARAFFLAPKPHLRHLSPLGVSRSLRTAHIKPNVATVLAVTIVAWCVAVVSAAAFFRGRRDRRRRKGSLQQLVASPKT